MMEAVIDIARGAGNILKRYWHGDYEVESKSKKHYDPVTVADIEADKYIRKQLRKRFPEDLILTEESSKDIKDFSGRVWIVDPLDGTHEFVSKTKNFSTLIGLCDKGKPVLGVVYAPLRDELYYAEKGKGAYLKNKGKKKKLKVSSEGNFGKARLMRRKYLTNKFWRWPLEAWKLRPFLPYYFRLTRFLKNLSKNVGKVVFVPRSGVGLRISRFATGMADVYVAEGHMIYKWDTCAPQVILEEAGGRMTDRKGRKLNYKQDSNSWKHSVVISNSKLHHELVTWTRQL